MLWHRKTIEGPPGWLIGVKENALAFGHWLVEAVGTTRFVLCSLDVVGFGLRALFVVVRLVGVDAVVWAGLVVTGLRVHLRLAIRRDLVVILHFCKRLL